MAKLIKKRGKYHAGHGYATGVGEKHQWTHDVNEARRYADNDPNVEGIAKRTGGKIENVPNTRREQSLLRRSLKREAEALGVLGRYLCKHCKREKGDHRAETFACPLTRHQFTHYHPTNRYEPDTNAPVKPPRFRI